ncbi:uncharacterized protein J2Z42_000291 [Clostridium algifaecis]|uniref:DUF177 domain-containing protein n=1 Tax=Clostridium algifaecis TaxID=1472040 RepID=A0ABS4KQG8_9CLOT|nr:YceD family protein [Clostridium algifaecis]MBP2031626.1 uncharacterized protein [Clostridium algifaecis]
MKLDVSDLLEKDLFTKELDLILEEDSFYDGSEHIDVVKPIKFSGSLEKTGDIFVLKGEVDTVLKLTCSRCLKKFDYAVNIEIYEKFTDSEMINKDEDIIFINNGYIDINEILENNIILTLPIKRLCKKDCKGLCPKCGTNLNDSTCNCKKDEVDPRWAELKNMFSKN